MSRTHLILCALALAILSSVIDASAKPPIRADFFAYYPSAVGTQLDDLPSNTKHCGVCHFDFNGGGPRNSYGFQVETGRNNGLSNAEVFALIDGEDSDSDGYSNHAEVTSVLFANTPTFPGLNPENVGNTLNIPLNEIQPYLVPSGGDDVTPPLVTLSYPNGGEVIQAGTSITVQYTASDDNGIAHVDFYLSDDSGSDWITIATTIPYTGSFEMFIPNLPGMYNRVQVKAVDNAGNPGFDESDTDFEILIQAGLVPTTLRDMELPGTQPHNGRILENPDLTCATCHGNYDTAVEPWANWKGSMMGQAMRDPLFLACMAVAEQDAPSVGDLCLRCHTPGGWQEGRSDDTSGGMITAKDRQSVQCDFCHAMVDWDYVSGISPQPDSTVVAAIDPPLMEYSDGSFILDPNPVRRGPRQDAQAAHDFLYSPIHRQGELCGTCHDVSNPVYWRDSTYDYSLTTMDEHHPNMQAHSMAPVERTYSEWTLTEYATTGVYAPEMVGGKADGIASTCQDCHMADTSGKAAFGGPVRSDLALHDLTGGNTFIPAILAQFFPDEVDQSHLDAGAQRARAMLQKAATLEVTPEATGVTVTVTNQTGHKLPSGYPEGRRMWLNVTAKDEFGATVFESGVWDSNTGELIHDEQLKIYQVEPGFSPGLAGAVGAVAGPSFHFVLSDTVYFDDRIPPRGFTNAGFESIQSPPVGYSYPDAQYWDDTPYVLPAEAESVVVNLYYQSTSKEYIEFLRDENHTNDMGDLLYNAWVAQGMNPPELMEQVRAAVAITGTATEPLTPSMVMFSPGQPNPFNGRTRFSYSLPRQARVEIAVYDLRGRKVRVLRNETQAPGHYFADWDGLDRNGRALASGIYLVRLIAGDQYRTQRVTLMH